MDWRRSVGGVCCGRGRGRGRRSGNGEMFILGVELVIFGGGAALILGEEDEGWGEEEDRDW